MNKTIAAIIMAGVLLVGCATPTAVPTATPTEGAAARTATAVPPTEAPTATPSDTPASTPTATSTPEPTNTPTPIPTYTLSGTVFFDHNGNGLRDAGEPPIGSAPLRVAGLSTTSGPDGSYSLAGVPAGRQQVYVESPTQEPAAAFRYVNRFLGWVDVPAYEMNGVSVPAQHLADTEPLPIDQPLRTTLHSDQGLDIALMQGFLTLPYQAQDAGLYWLSNYCDLDVAVGSVRNYAGNATMIGDPSQYREVDGTTDQHYGIDYEGPEGRWVVSPAPGRVGYIGTHPTIGSRQVAVLHVHRIESTMGHLKEWVVDLRQPVLRGQIVGVNGTTGSSHPHIHFGVYDLATGPATNPPALDPYRDLVQTNFRYEVYPDRAGHQISVGSPGYWTVDNQPRFPPP